MKRTALLFIAPFLPVLIVWVVFAFMWVWGFDPVWNPLEWSEVGRGLGVAYSIVFTVYMTMFLVGRILEDK